MVKMTTNYWFFQIADRETDWNCQFDTPTLLLCTSAVRLSLCHNSSDIIIYRDYICLLLFLAPVLWIASQWVIGCDHATSFFPPQYCELAEVSSLHQCYEIAEILTEIKLTFLLCAGAVRFTDALSGVRALYAASLFKRTLVALQNLIVAITWRAVIIRIGIPCKNIQTVNIRIGIPCIIIQTAIKHIGNQCINIQINIICIDQYTNCHRTHRQPIYKLSSYTYQ